MQRRRFGGSGLELSVVGLGVVPLALPGRPSDADAIRVIHAALDAGVTWIDTADVYCAGEHDVGYGEALVRRALDQWTGPRADVFVATKGGHVRPGGDWRTDGSPEHLRAACEASLRALGVDVIDLYQLHRPDPKVYFPDSVGALETLRKEGKIRHIGLSNVDVDHIDTACKIAPITSVQNCANPFDRRAFANGVIERCERNGIAFVAHSPVGGHGNHKRIREHSALSAIAEGHAVSLYEIALAWLLSVSESLFVIPGASRVESARSSAHAGSVVLSEEDERELRRAFPPAGPLVKRLVSIRRTVRTLVREVRRTS